MIATLRFQPGEIAPCSGNYELVRHFGERVGRSIECVAGSPLPLVEATDELLWWEFRDMSAPPQAEAA